MEVRKTACGFSGRYQLIQRRYPHHGAAAFAHCGKSLYEGFIYFGIGDIAYNQPEGMPCTTEPPWGSCKEVERNSKKDFWHQPEVLLVFHRLSICG